MHTASAAMLMCAVRREVLGFSAGQVAHYLVFNLECAACRSTEIHGIGVWRKLHAMVD
jgi:hypothetical protein